MPDTELLAARRILERHPVLDGHNDLPIALREAGLAGPGVARGYDPAVADVTGPLEGTHTDVPRLREGCVGGQFWSVFVDASLAGERAVTTTLEQVDLVRTMIATHPDALAFATTADDVERAFADGRIASLIGMEGGHSIDSSLGALRMFAALGARYMTLTHNDNTPWADSATDEPAVGGLTDFGREVVREMQRLGMLVDLSHVAPTTMHAALDVARAPVLFSHSSCRALADHPRNVPDDVLARVRDTAGVVMITLVPMFLSEAAAAWARAAQDEMRAEGLDADDWMVMTRFMAERDERLPFPHVSVADVADHVDHARHAMGADHVGIGGDYDGVHVLPRGMEDVRGYPLLFAELLRRGWSEAELAGLACRNAIRVLRAAEDAAR
ncbi:MAG: dipeptidase [Actinomycetota bacterium]